jgi:hypothetical protein
MAHQRRKRVCAITIGALGKTNGAKGAPLGFFQWSANGTMALFSWTPGHNPALLLSGLSLQPASFSNGGATIRRLH